MNAKKRPLTIFLFNGCASRLCKDTHSIILKRLHLCSRLLSTEVPCLVNKEINLVIADGRMMRGMNWRFRDIDSSTDVLSFPLGDGVLGEIWVCPSVVKRNSRLFDQPFERELLRVSIHGALHLAGYDHKRSFFDKKSSREQMFILQEKVLNAVMLEKE